MAYIPIGEELKEAGIERKYFISVYAKLEKTGELPGRNAMPKDQYAMILNYLMDKGVLDEKAKVQPDAMKRFTRLVTIDDLLEKDKKQHPGYDSREPFKSSGGLAPCRHDNDLLNSSGGLAPCRD